MKIRRFGQPNPLLSVCVPTLDAYSGQCDKLMYRLAMTTKARYEVVVADCERELLGYTAPMNAAMDASFGRYVLAVNDDVLFAQGWFPPLLSALLVDEDVWCVTPDATHTDGPQVFHPWMMLWRRTAWFDIGGLDSQFVFWCSDIDLARRLVDAGHPPVKVKLPSPVVHELNATARGHPTELAQICRDDLERFQHKWGLSAEEEKHRLAAL